MLGITLIKIFKSYEYNNLLIYVLPGEKTLVKRKALFLNFDITVLFIFIEVLSQSIFEESCCSILKSSGIETSHVS